MQLGIIGLGRMGGNMAVRLKRNGHTVIGYDPSAEAGQSFTTAGGKVVGSIPELIAALKPPRAIWVMVPQGDPTETNIRLLASLVSKGDVIIDGGNSQYKEAIRRATFLREKGIHFLDVGTSGGIWGLTEGYSLMIGGEKAAVDILRPVFESLAPAPDKGWAHVGPNGAGHFVKMVHNGIEYGLMQAYAEGFTLMQHKSEFDLDLHKIAETWSYGSVVRSWLLSIVSEAVAKNPDMKGIKAYVADTGEGRWTVQEAIDLGVPVPVISMALQQRFSSQDDSPYGDRLLAVMRQIFGGHEIKAG